MSEENKKTLTGRISSNLASVPGINRLVASYKPPTGEQVKQAERGEAWWRDFAWEEYACTSPDTEILTEDGWKFMGDVKVGEEVATLSPEGYVEYQPTIQTFYTDKYDKGLVHFKSDKIDLLVTPNHKMILRPQHWEDKQPLPQDKGDMGWTYNGFKFIYAGDALNRKTHLEIKKDAKWIGKELKTIEIDVEIPSRNGMISIQKLSYQAVPFLRFLGYYLSEGSVNDSNQNGIYNVIRLTQLDSSEHHSDVKQKMIATFRDLGFNPSSDKKEVRVCDSKLATWLHSLGGKAWEKKLPAFIFNLSSSLLREFLESYIEGDGYEHANKKSTTPIIYTTSPFIRDSLQELALKVGWAADWTTRKGGWSDRQQYVITIIKKRTTPDINRRNGITYEPYTGEIACVSVPKYHTLYVRRNGKACWTGNTQYLPGLGLAFNVYPYVAVWEKIWGAVPTEDYIKYKQYYVQEPVIRATIDIHTMMAFSQGFEVDYPVDTVVEDVRQFLERHDFLNGLKILGKDVLTFGNSYIEVVRLWICPQTGHDLSKLRVSFEEVNKQRYGWWWTDRMDVVARHNEMYPDHVLENPYGEIVRLKYLDPTYMRVRRDAYGSLAPTERIIFYNGDMLQMGTIGEYASKIQGDATHNIEYINENTRLIKHPFSLPSLIGNSIGMAPSPHLLEHNYDGDMYVIETRGGRKIDVTGNHSVFLWKPDNPKQNVKKGKQILKEARDIRVGDYVVLSKSLPIPDKLFSSLSIYQLLSNSNLKLWKQNGMVCHKKSKITETIENTEDFLYALGLYVAEGSYVYNSHGYRIEWSGDRAKKVIPFLESIGIKYSYKLRKNGSYGKSDKFYDQIKQCPIISVSNRLLVETVKKLGLLEKTIPSWVFELPRYQLNHFLAGLWDGDGRHNGKMPDFEFYTKDRRLAEDVSLLLNRFGIFAYIYEKDVHKNGILYYTVQAVVTPVNPIEWKYGVKQKLGMASIDDIVLAKVTKIKKYSYSGPVYDFEVPSSQAFLNANAIVAHNTVLGYVQWYMFPLVTLLADEVMHLRYMPSSWTYESVYGVSMLRPILFHQELIKQYETTMGQIIQTYLKPMFIVKVGNPNSPTGDVRIDQYQQVIQAFARRKPGTDVVVRTGGVLADVQPVQAPIQSLQSSAFWLQWLHSMRIYALTIPKFLTDPAGLNRATAQIVQESYFTFITSIRQMLGSQIQQELMPKIMRSLYGALADTLMKEYGVPKLIWKAIKEESLKEKAPIYMDLWKSKLISRNDARTALGFKPLSPEEEDLLDAEGLEAETSPPITRALSAPDISDVTTTITPESSMEAEQFQDLISQELAQTSPGGENKTEELDYEDQQKEDHLDVKLSDLEDWISEMRDKIRVRKEERQSKLFENS